MGAYDATAVFWNGVFAGEKPGNLTGASKLPRELAGALDWLTASGGSILDFGCGSGTLLMLCAAGKASGRRVGIDISKQAVALAQSTAELNGLADQAVFICAGMEALEALEDASFDGAILSNIIDNVLPEDAEALLGSIHRIVRPRGRILVKLNPYLSEELIARYGLKRIKEQFYREQDGIFLRNLETEQWRNLLDRYFTEQAYSEVYFIEADAHNRLFLLINN